MKFIPCIRLGIIAAFPFLATSFAFANSSHIAPLANAKCRSADFKGVQRFTAELNNVVDGDTVKITYKGKRYNVRLLSIDTPETHFQGKSQGEWGEKAANRLEELLSESSQVEVRIEEGNTCDRYGRLLGYIYQNGVNMNEEMVREGLAVMYCIYPSLAACKKLSVLNQASIDQQLGIFSDDSVELPYEWRRIISHRSPEKWVGNLATKEVFAPGNLDEVPVAQRVFFMKESDIRAPFHKVESR
jgi:micrococcal nuclease